MSQSGSLRCYGHPINSDVFKKRTIHYFFITITCMDRFSCGINDIVLTKPTNRDILKRTNEILHDAIF